MRQWYQSCNTSKDENWVKPLMHLLLGVSVPQLHRSVVGGRDDGAVSESQHADSVAVGLEDKTSALRSPLNHFSCSFSFLIHTNPLCYNIVLCRSLSALTGFLLLHVEVSGDWMHHMSPFMSPHTTKSEKTKQKNKNKTKNCNCNLL